MKIEINFYDDIKIIRGAENFSSLKERVSKLYLLEPSDVEELCFTYLDEDKDKISISNENDFNLAKNVQDLKINIEISEKSKLFKSELFLSKTNSIEEKNKQNASTKELIEKEIAEKQKALEEIMKKEEQAKKEKEELVRLEEEKNKLEIEQKLKEEKEKLEKEKKEYEEKVKEEENKRKNLLEEEETKRQIITEIINNTVQEKLEVLKKDLIEQTVKASLHNIENIFNGENPFKSEVPKEVVHHGVRCDGCGVFPIRGIRYKCTECHDFDYCSTCEEVNSTSHKHSFIKMREADRGCPGMRGMRGHGGHHGHGGEKFMKKMFQKVIDMTAGFNETQTEKKECNRSKSKKEKEEKKEKKDETVISIETKADISSPKEKDDIEVEIVEKKEEIVDDDVLKVQVEEIQKNYELNNITPERIMDILKIYNGNYEKAVEELFNEQSILFKN